MTSLDCPCDLCVLLHASFKPFPPPLLSIIRWIWLYSSSRSPASKYYDLQIIDCALSLLQCSTECFRARLESQNEGCLSPSSLKSVLDEIQSEPRCKSPQQIDLHTFRLVVTLTAPMNLTVSGMPLTLTTSAWPSQERSWAEFLWKIWRQPPDTWSRLCSSVLSTWRELEISSPRRPAISSPDTTRPTFRSTASRTPSRVSFTFFFIWSSQDYRLFQFIFS